MAPTEVRGDGRPSGSSVTNHERSPLLGADSHQPSYAAGGGPASTDYLSSGSLSTSDSGSDDEEIEENDLDRLISRRASFSGGPMLEPESQEHSMLRGLRRGSRKSHGSRQRDAASRKPRRPSAASQAIADDAGPGSEGTAASPPDPEAAPGGQGPESPFLGGVTVTRFWLIFAEILATYFIACFDGTIMASSHPVITSHFRSSNSASWLSTAFLLTSTAFQPLMGRLSDTLGRKRPYIVTMVVFTLATVWCALATSITSFIAARAFCGLGAGSMMTLGNIMISDLVPIERRGTYQSYVNMIYGVGSALGAALGGAMADHLGWRWEFGVQVPPLLLCVVVASLALPKDLGLYGKKRESFMEAMSAFDIRGSALLTVSITFLILGLNLGGNVLPWLHPFVMTSLVIFGVCFPLFLFVETTAGRPIMPLGLIRRSPHANLIFSNFIAALLVNSILFNIPLFFQGVLLESATRSGLRLVVPSAVASAVGTATGFLIAYTRRLKWPLVGGTAGFLAGTLALSAMRRGWPPALYLACLVPAAAGQGLQFPGTVMAVLAASEQRAMAVVTSTLVLWRSLGMVLGVAGSSLVVQNALVAYLGRFVAGPDRAGVIARVRASVEAVGALPLEYREQVVRSYEAALRLTFLCCAGLAAVSVLLIVPLRLPRLGEGK